MQRRKVLQMLLGIVAIALLAVSSSNDAVAETPAGAMLQIGGAQIEVSFEDGDLGIARASAISWIARSACAVTEYYARFPVRHLRVIIVPLEDGKGVTSGKTFIPDRVPVTRVMLGRFTTESDLREDWVMTHEMVHLAFPSVAREHHWMEEGIATYVEPIARAQVGDLRSEKVWRDLVAGLPKGLPTRGDKGLDHTHRWGRTYWGGALFCLLADVEIHRRTDNRFGLQDALRAIAKAGNMEQNWPLDRALKVGDDTVGVPVLTGLYNKMKDAPVDPNLANMWHELGVQVAADSVRFDKMAPLASIVASIMAPRADRATCGWIK